MSYNFYHSSLFPDIKIIFQKNETKLLYKVIFLKDILTFFSLSSPDNFSITILSRREFFFTIENLKIFKGIEKKISHKGNIYIQKLF